MTSLGATHCFYFASFQYVVLPVWWDGESPRSPFDRGYLQGKLAEVSEYYREMSWNKHTLEFEVLNQVVLPGVTPQNADFDNSIEAARAIIADLGLVEFEHYIGILLCYNLAETGPFKGGGGWAGVNGKSDLVRHHPLIFTSFHLNDIVCNR